MTTPPCLQRLGGVVGKVGGFGDRAGTDINRVDIAPRGGKIRGILHRRGRFRSMKGVSKDERAPVRGGMAGQRAQGVEIADSPGSGIADRIELRHQTRLWVSDEVVGGRKAGGRNNERRFRLPACGGRCVKGVPPQWQVFRDGKRRLPVGCRAGSVRGRACPARARLGFIALQRLPSVVNGIIDVSRGGGILNLAAVMPLTVFGDYPDVHGLAVDNVNGEGDIFAFDSDNSGGKGAGGFFGVKVFASCIDAGVVVGKTQAKGVQGVLECFVGDVHVGAAIVGIGRCNATVCAEGAEFF